MPAEARLDYIRELWSYQRTVGGISPAKATLLPDPQRLETLRKLLGQWWLTTLDLVAEAKHGMEA